MKLKELNGIQPWLILLFTPLLFLLLNVKMFSVSKIYSLLEEFNEVMENKEFVSLITNMYVLCLICTNKPLQTLITLALKFYFDTFKNTI